jgi:hypothetical protein
MRQGAQVTYDFLEGKIDIDTAFRQEGTCKHYVNSLASSGIQGAVEQSSDYAQLQYYYYKTQAYVRFYKNGVVGFTLTLQRTPTYFRSPRIVPGPEVLNDKLQNVDMAAKLKLVRALKDENGKPKEFTAKELGTLIESVLGKQDFDATKWVISNLFDKDAQKFMSCVPDIDKLAELPYDANGEKTLRESFANSEKTMRDLISKARG